jgi:hypothetical protein
MPRICAPTILPASSGSSPGVLEVAPVARLAHQVHAAGQHDVEAVGARFRTDHGAALVGQLDVPGGGGIQAGRQRGAGTGFRPRLAGHAQAGVGFPQVRNAHARHAINEAGRLLARFGRPPGMLVVQVIAQVAVYQLELLVQGHGAHGQLGAFARRQARIHPGLAGGSRIGGGGAGRDGAAAQRRGNKDTHCFHA